MNLKLIKNQLNPDFWENESLKPEIRLALLKIAEMFYKESNLNIPLYDIYFLGSSTSYNWTNTSDIDLHLLVNFNDLKMDKDTAKNYTKSLCFKWNVEQNIIIKKHTVEVYIQDLNEQNASESIYSLLSNKWIKKPIKKQVNINKDIIDRKYKLWVTKINKSISENNIDNLKLLVKSIANMRKTGLDAGGEFSIENIIFKLLRKRNVIKRIKNKIISLKNKELSIK